MKKHEVGDKFVIEIDKVFHQDGETLYRAKGMKSLVFDEYGLNILKPLSAYTDPLEKEAEQKWVSVSERLPETEDKVICCAETKKGDKNIVIGYYMECAWRCGMNSNVIAWQPLPEPYKVGDQE